MEKRTLLYWAREYTENISAGDDYSDLPKVITINIVDFDNIKIERFHTSFHIREYIEKSCILTDVLEIHFLNMVKFRKTADKDIKNDALCQRLTYFDVNTPEKDLEEVKKMNTAIQKADERLVFVTQDKDFLRNYHRRQMELSDLTTMRNTTLEKGRNEGLVDVIRDLTGLKAEEIILLQTEK